MDRRNNNYSRDSSFKNIAENMLNDPIAQGKRKQNKTQMDAFDSLKILDELSGPLLQKQIFDNGSWVQENKNKNQQQKNKNYDLKKMDLTQSRLVEQDEDLQRDQKFNRRRDNLMEQIEQQNQILLKLMKQMNEQKINGSYPIQQNPQEQNYVSQKEEQLKKELQQLKQEIQELQKNLNNPNNFQQQIMQQQQQQMINPFALQQMQLQNPAMVGGGTQNIQQMIKEAIKEKYLEDKIRELQEKQNLQMLQQQQMLQMSQMMHLQQQPQQQPQPVFYPQYPPPQYPPQDQYNSYKRRQISRDSSRQESVRKQKMPSPQPKTPPEIIDKNSPKSQISRKSTPKPSFNQNQQPSNRQLSQIPSQKSPLDQKSSSKQPSQKSLQPSQPIQKNQKAFKKLQKWIRYTIMAMFLLIGNKKRELQRRQEYLNDFQTLFREACVPALDWTVACLENPLKMIDSKVNYDVTSNTAQKLPQKDFKIRVQKIIAFIESVFTNFNEQTNDDEFPRILSFFMALAYTEQSFLPKSYMFEFELIRLDYNPNLGYLKNVTARQREMLISFFLVVRFILGNVLIRPWEYQQEAKVKVPQDPNTKYLLKFVVSFIYNHIINHYSRLVPIQEKQLQNVDEKIRPYPIQQTLPLRVDDKDQIKPLNSTRDQVMNGCFSSEEIQKFVLEAGTWIDMFRKMYDEFIMKIDELVVNVHKIVLERKKIDNIKQARINYNRNRPPKAYDKFLNVNLN